MRAGTCAMSDAVSAMRVVLQMASGWARVVRWMMKANMILWIPQNVTKFRRKNLSVRIFSTSTNPTPETIPSSGVEFLFGRK